MAGHSKWAQIKRKKAVTDAKKSTVFGKISKRITVEAKKAGGDMHAPNLRAAIEKAKAANMPIDNIERAIQKGADKDAAAMEELMYEAYGPGGTALVIVGLTDSRNRTGQFVRHVLSMHSISLAGQGAATWAFEKAADVWVPKTTVTLSNNDQETLAKIIEDLENLEDIQEVFTNAE